MHILFLTDNFSPEVNAPANRTFEHCREWVKAGHTVTVVTCVPNFPSGKVHKGYKNKIYQTEIIDRIQVIRVWSYIAKNEGFVKRIIDYLSFMIMSILACLFVRRIDIVIGTSPQFFTAISAFVTAKIKRKPFVFELRDIWPASIKAVGVLKKNSFIIMLEKLELFLYRKADLIISVTHSFKNTLAGRGIDPSKICIITNGVNTDEFKPRHKDIDIVKELDLKGKLVVGYIGTLGLAHSLETVLQAANIIQKIHKPKDIVFVLVGDGAKKETLKSCASKFKLDNVIFVDTVSRAEVGRYWSVLDLALIHLKKDELFTQVIPSKMFEAMAMGVPLLHGVEGESAQIVEQHQIGICFEPENEEMLANSILSLRADTTLVQKLSSNGKKATAAYERKNLASQMEEQLSNLITDKIVKEKL